jgi:predicted nucleic acid-binding protein
MIAYLDSSALVKRYVAEAGSAQVSRLIAQVQLAGTCVITRAEVVAALSKAVRTQALTLDQATRAARAFRTQWPNVIRLQLSEAVVARADALAWEYGLRGYDAIHLASALFWQEMLGEAITLMTFDRQLWHTGPKAGVSVWPDELDQFVA